MGLIGGKGSKRFPEMDTSARAGMLAAGFVAGASTQPNLLTRGTRDQAIITGASSVIAYGWGAAGHSFLRSVADRLPLPATPAGLLVDGAAAAVGAAAIAALRPRPHEKPARALGRLAGRFAVSAGAAGAMADALEVGRGRRGGRTAALTALAGTTVAAWSLTRPGRASYGSALPDGGYFENTPRSVSTAQSIVFGAVTAGLVYGFSQLESSLATASAAGAAKVLGGTTQDHRTVGRLTATGLSYGAGWLALGAVTAKLTRAGDEVEVASIEAPKIAEVTGGPGSPIPWDRQSREGTRWLSAVLSPAAIEEVMEDPARQPIRVYASLASAPTEEERARVLLEELERTGAFDRASIALFSPTGSGYVNYAACETYEYLARGDCASMAIEYSVLPSALSLTKATTGTRQTRIVVDLIAQRLAGMPTSSRPRFYLFGESLGSRVSQDMFLGAGDSGLRAVGIDAAVWVGTPAFTEWRKRMWADTDPARAPQIGPDAIYLPRDVSDWQALPRDERQFVQYLLLQNGDDPVPKFDSTLLWRQPDWLGPDATRPPGAPRGTRWMPVTTFLTTFIDLMNALTPTPGRFDEGGHDYRAAIPDAIRQVWGLPATNEQMRRVIPALEARELAWEVKRVWEAACAQPEAKRAKAQAKAAAVVGGWIGADAPPSPERIRALYEVPLGMAAAAS